MTSGNGNLRPYRIGDSEARDRKELAQLLRDQWEESEEHLKRGYIGKWLEEDLRDFDAKLKLEKLLETDSVFTAHYKLQAFLDPETQPLLGGDLPISREGLLGYINSQREEDGLPSRNAAIVVQSVMEHGLTEDPVTLKFAPELAGIRDALSRAAHDYLRARGKMLLMADLWRDPTGQLGEMLDPARQQELYAAEFALGEHEEDREGILESTILHQRVMPDLLESLLKVAPDFEKAAPNVEIADFDSYAETARRPWYKALIEEAGSTLGGKALLRQFYKLAFIEQMFASTVTDQDPKDVKLEKRESERWFLRLPRPARAAIFAVPMLAYASTVDPWGNQFDAMFFTSVITGGAVATLFAAWRGFDQKSFWIAAFVAALFVGPFLNSMLLGGTLGAIVMAALVGAAGWFSEDLVTRRRLKEERGKLAERKAKFASTGGKLTLHDLRQIFFPRRLHEIPQDERTPEVVRRAEAMAQRDGTVLMHSQAADEVRKQGVAPNSPDGVAMMFGGTVVGTNGNVTHSIGKDFSFDKDGNWNMQVVDGVTMHSDGKYTTRVAGMDVRSDGQISHEIGGFRFSHGGKEEKKSGGIFAPKEETDWFGNKKDKGWGEW